jgi:hypothetical protein
MVAATFLLCFAAGAAAQSDPAVSGDSRASLHLANHALRRQLGVLQRGVCSNWRSALVMVKPETVIAWHRKDSRFFWTWMIRHGQPG